MLEHRTADVNGITMHYVTAGAGKLMVFLHGFPEFWYCWRDILPEFAKDHQVVAPDMRGYNLTSKPQAVEEYALPKLTEDIRQLAKHLGHEKFTLVAHDWGGGVAWSLAIRNPEVIERLIIVNMAHPSTFLRELTNNPAQQKASQYTLMFQTPKAEALLSANNYAALYQVVMGEGRFEAGVFDEADRKAYLEAWSQPGAITGALNYYRASKAGPPAGDKPARTYDPGVGTTMVKMPTLVIWGEKDTAVLAANLDGLEEWVPNLTVRRIPDGTHWVIHEKPAEIIKHIRAFIA
jgi:pimeloyl-ACP methyl ester carboxylesterase